MTLVFRAIWRDDRDNLGTSVLSSISKWVLDRSDGQIDASKPGTYTAEVGTQGSSSIISTTTETLKNDSDAVDVVYLSYAIDNAKRGMRWHTVVRAWIDQEGQGWCWIDNAVSGDGVPHPRELDVISPLIARELLDTAENARVGDDFNIGTSARRYSGSAAAEDLGELITNFERSIPVVVFARSDARFAEYGRGGDFSDIVRATSERLAGIAVVVDADEDVANTLTDMWGREHGVFNGAFRVYIRDFDPAVDAYAYRHRYVTADRYMGDIKRAGAIAGRIVGPDSTLRRPPASYDWVRERLDRARVGADDFEDLYKSATDGFKRAQALTVELREENVALLKWKREHERVSAQLDYAKKLLITSRVADNFDGDGTGNFYTRSPETSKEAVDFTRKYLSDRVEIHPEALVDAKKMDCGRVGATWAQQAWLGFRTLYAYGDFLANNPSSSVDLVTWCQGQHNTTGWSADRVARGESGKTKDDHKGTRVFPCSVQLSRNELVEMVAHLKIQKSGGGSIPRIYFLYSNRTKKVHVGFYGPHDRVPNTKS